MAVTTVDRSGIVVAVAGRSSGASSFGHAVAAGKLRIFSWSVVAVCFFQAATTPRGSLAQDSASWKAVRQHLIVLGHDQRAHASLEIGAPIVGAGEQDFVGCLAAESMRKDRGGRLRQDRALPEVGGRVHSRLAVDAGVAELADQPGSAVGIPVQRGDDRDLATRQAGVETPRTSASGTAPAVPGRKSGNSLTSTMAL